MNILFAVRHALLCYALVALSSSQASAQPFAVVSVAPAANAVSAARDAHVVVTFNAPVDRATFDRTTVMVFGRWSGVMDGAFQLEAGDTRLRFVPQRPFAAGEMVTVSLARRVAAAAGAPLARGYAWQFWTRPRRALLDLRETSRLAVRRPGEGWIQTYGAYAGDLDEDGYTDLAVPNERTNDVRIFLNDGTGGFVPTQTYAIPGGSFPSTNVGADFNGDGHIDFAVGHRRNDQVSVFMGDGRGHLLPPTNYTTDDGVRGLAVLDLDGDGFMDLATASRDAGTVSTLRNDGRGGFSRTHRFDAQGVGETAAAAADANEDGILDLFVGAIHSEEIIVLLGDGQGGLAFHAKVPAGGASWMITTGDVDGDGHVDVASANAHGNHASVLLGDGQGNLSAPDGYPTGGFPLAIELGDLDGDGDLDLVTSNFNGRDWTIYENVGDGTFGHRRSLRAAEAGSCAVLHDRDNDGTLDLTGIDEVTDQLFLFTNAPLPTATEPPMDRARTPGLLPAFPNPFIEATTIPFDLDVAATLRVAIYDLLGRPVRTLLDGTLPAGVHRLSWDGRDDAGYRVPAGPYLCRLETAHHSRTLLLHLLKPSGAPEWGR